MNTLFVPITRDIFNVEVLKPGMFIKFSIAFETVSAGGFVKKTIRVENHGLLTYASTTELGIVMSPNTAECVTSDYVFEEGDRNDYLNRLRDGKDAYIGNDFYHINIDLDAGKDMMLELSYMEESDTLVDKRPVYYWR